MEQCVLVTSVSSPKSWIFSLRMLFLIKVKRVYFRPEPLRVKYTIEKSFIIKRFQALVKSIDFQLKNWPIYRKNGVKSIVSCLAVSFPNWGSTKKLNLLGSCFEILIEYLHLYFKKRKKNKGSWEKSDNRRLPFNF